MNSADKVVLRNFPASQESLNIMHPGLRDILDIAVFRETGRPLHKEERGKNVPRDNVVIVLRHVGDHILVDLSELGHETTTAYACAPRDSTPLTGLALGGKHGNKHSPMQQHDYM